MSEKSPASTQKKTTIGWKEDVDFPNWGIENLTAKIDTGARRSAIDVTNIVELPGNKIQFDVALKRKNRSFTQTIVSEIAHQTHVRSSNGQTKERYFVETTIEMGGISKKIDLSLVCRKNMTFRMLIGRKALEGEFLVDTSQTFITRERKRTLVKPPAI